MTPAEDLVRSTTRAVADTVTEVPPLRLSAPAHPADGARSRHVRRLRNWLAPLTAAVAVAAIAVSLLVVRDFAGGHPAPSTTATTGPDGIPRYYVELKPTGTGPSPTPNALVIGDALTGSTLATIQPPAGRSFFGVMAAADDRTFVVDTLPVKGEINPVEPRTWYLLRLAPGTGAAAQLSRLPLPSLSYITALALSRSGDELAIASGGAEALGTVGKLAPGVLRLYSVATGKLLRTWTSTDQSAFDADGIAGENTQDLTWIDDDRGIAFLSAAGHLGTAPARQKLTETLHVLDVNAPGDSLLGDSRVVWSQTTTQAADLGPTICSWEADVLVSADGKTIVCPSVSVSAAVAGKGERWTLRWLAYSTSAPTVASTLFTVTINQASSAAPVIYSQWIGGKTIIADWYLYNDGMSGEPHIGVVSNGHFTPLPVPVLSLPGLNEPGIAW